MAKKQSYSMPNTEPASRVKADPGMSRTHGAFATPLGLDRAVGGLKKFRIGKMVGRYPSVAENFSLLLIVSFSLAEHILLVMLTSNPGCGSKCFF